MAVHFYSRVLEFGLCKELHTPSEMQGPREQMLSGRLSLYPDAQCSPWLAQIGYLVNIRWQTDCCPFTVGPPAGGHPVYTDRILVFTWETADSLCLTPLCRNSVRVTQQSSFFWLHRVLVVACGIQVPQQGWNPAPLYQEQRVLATGPPGNSPSSPLDSIFIYALHTSYQFFGLYFHPQSRMRVFLLSPSIPRSLKPFCLARPVQHIISCMNSEPVFSYGGNALNCVSQTQECWEHHNWLCISQRTGGPLISWVYRDYSVY